MGAERRMPRRAVNGMLLRWLRRGPSEAEKLKTLGLGDHQIYPEAGGLSPAFVASPRRPRFTLDKRTPIASMGSCFAREIKQHLVSRGFNYVQTEHNAWSIHASCAWERVYSPAHAYQIFRYTLSGRVDEARLLARGKKVLDLWRHKIAYPDHDEAVADIKRHIDASRRAIEQTSLFILTVGQNETWRHRTGDYWFAQRPPSDSFPETDLELRQLSVEENLDLLRRCRQAIQQINPHARLLVTLSPVPSNATFFDENVAVRSVLNKSILRVALARFVEESAGEVAYFPSYEIVQTWRGNAFLRDNRHVKPEVVKAIMSSFVGLYHREN